MSINSILPCLVPDPGRKRLKAALLKSGFQSWSEVHNMLEAVKTKDEELAIYKKLPMKPLVAVMIKKDLGKEAFLAEGYNLEYANESLGGPDWVDRL